MRVFTCKYRMRLRSLLDRILVEARAPLYHGTSLGNAVEIVRDGAFQALTAHIVNGRSIRGLSTTRDPRLLHINKAEHVNKQPGKIIRPNVVFVLDQERIRQRYKVVPVDFWSPYRHNHVFSDLRSRFEVPRHESEEFIVFDRDARLPVVGFVTKVILLDDSFGDGEADYEDTKKVQAFCQKHGIPFVIDSYTKFDYDDKTAPWGERQFFSRVRHPDKNEVNLNSWTQKRTRYIINNVKAAYEAGRRDFGPVVHTTLWQFWDRMNDRRPKRREEPVPDEIMRRIFQAVGNSRAGIVFHKPGSE